MSISDYYVYEHWRPDLNICFWVGQGRRRRAYDKNNHNADYDKVIEELKQQGLVAEIIFYAVQLSQERAIFLEIERIAFYRAKDTCYLTNKSGGPGTLGIKASTETRALMSAKHKGKVLTEAHKQKIAIARIGLSYGPHSEEHKAKIAAANLGKKMSDEAKAKMSIAARSRPHEYWERVSKALKGRPLAPEHVAKLKAAIRPPHTEEQLTKMREAQRLRRANNPVSQETRDKVRESVRKSWEKRRQQ